MSVSLTAEYDTAFDERKAAAEVFAGALGSSDEPSERAWRSWRLTRSSRACADEVSNGFASEKASFSDTNYVFPTFVLTKLPIGVVGLILVAIFAAAMSTVESELTSLSTATVVDFYRRYVRTAAEDGHYLIVSRIATVFWGGFATFCALYMGRLGSAIEAVNRIGSNFYGPILGVFVLAVGTRRANGHGAFAGILLGIVAVQLTVRYVEVSYLYYNFVGTAVAVVFGYGLSRVFSTSKPSV